MPKTQEVVLYIHGFASSGLGQKADLLRRHYKENGIPFLAPSLSHIPDLAVSTLEEIVTTCGTHSMRVVGGSLGGFYAAYLSQRYDLPAVLINPAMQMEDAHTQLLGLQQHAYDGSCFECSEAHFASLRRVAETLGDLSDSRVLLLMQKGDAVVDYRNTLQRFEGLPSSQIVLEEGGSHLFEGLESKLPLMDAFLGLKAYNPTKKETGI
jgi:predicted esterase YcpF (UPF0227 family)